MNSLNTELTQKISDLLPEAGLMTGCSDEVCEILGKAIELRHIMLVFQDLILRLDENFPDELCHMAIDQDGQFFWYKVRNPDDGYFVTGKYYDFQHNLYGQSEETRLWLKSLLTK